MPKFYFLKPMLLIIAYCLLNVLHAQFSVVKQWDKRFGGVMEERLTCVQETKDGGYILGGYSWSKIGGDKTETTQGDFDYWIVKINANGIKQWDKRFGGQDVDILRSIQETEDGGYILGGSSFSGMSGDRSESNRGSSDYWIVKIDANGQKKWDKRYGGNGADDLFFLHQTTDKGFILGGNSQSDVSGDKTEANWNISDFWIIKVDVNGVKQWDKRLGGINDDEFKTIQQTKDGGYIVGGEYSCHGDPLFL